MCPLVAEASQENRLSPQVWLGTRPGMLQCSMWLLRFGFCFECFIHGVQHWRNAFRHVFAGHLCHQATERLSVYDASPRRNFFQCDDFLVSKQELCPHVSSPLELFWLFQRSHDWRVPWTVFIRSFPTHGDIQLASKLRSATCGSDSWAPGTPVLDIGDN